MKRIAAAVALATALLAVPASAQLMTLSPRRFSRP